MRDMKFQVIEYKGLNKEFEVVTFNSYLSFTKYVFTHSLKNKYFGCAQGVI